MSFKPYTEKIKKKKIGICSRTGPGSGSIIPEADPRIRIRIRIKMIRIGNTELKGEHFQNDQVIILDLKVHNKNIDAFRKMKENSNFYVLLSIYFT